MILHRLSEIHVCTGAPGFSSTLDNWFVYMVSAFCLSIAFFLFFLGGGGGVAQLVERPTEKPGAVLLRVRVSGAARDFSPGVSFH